MHAAHGELARLGSAAVPPLIDFMRNDLTPRGQRAWWTLIRIGAPGAPMLADLARHEPTPWVRAAATWVLAHVDNRSIERVLLAGLDDCDREVQLVATLTLGWRGCYDAVGGLLRILTNGHYDDQSFPHADQLRLPLSQRDTGGRGDESDLLPERLGKCGHKALQSTALSSLPHIEPPTPADVAEIILSDEAPNGQDVSDDDLMCLGHERGDEFAPGWVIVPWCHWEANDLREAAALALGRIGDSRAVPPLLTCLEDDNEPASLRNWVIDALWMIGDQRAFDDIYEASFDSELEDSALLSLGCFGDLRALARLAPLVTSGRWADRHNAAYGLSELTDPAVVRYLLRLSDDKDDDICRQAAIGLARVGSQGALECVASLLSHRNAELRRLAAELLRQAESRRASQRWPQ